MSTIIARYLLCRTLTNWTQPVHLDRSDAKKHCEHYQISPNPLSNHGLEIYASNYIFVDLVRAFDTVNHELQPPYETQHTTQADRSNSKKSHELHGKSWSRERKMLHQLLKWGVTRRKYALHPLPIHHACSIWNAWKEMDERRRVIKTPTW